MYLKDDIRKTQFAFALYNSEYKGLEIFLTKCEKYVKNQKNIVFIFLVNSNVKLVL